MALNRDTTWRYVLVVVAVQAHEAADEEDREEAAEDGPVAPGAVVHPAKQHAVDQECQLRDHRDRQGKSE